MSVFFYICDYLEISPMEFFDMGFENPNLINELIKAVRGLDNSQIESLIVLAKGLKR